MGDVDSLPQGQVLHLVRLQRIPRLHLHGGQGRGSVAPSFAPAVPPRRLALLRRRRQGVRVPRERKRLRAGGRLERLQGVWAQPHGGCSRRRRAGASGGLERLQGERLVLPHDDIDEVGRGGAFPPRGLLPLAHARLVRMGEANPHRDAVRRTRRSRSGRRREGTGRQIPRDHFPGPGRNRTHTQLPARLLGGWLADAGVPWGGLQGAGSQERCGANRSERRFQALSRHLRHLPLRRLRQQGARAGLGVEPQPRRLGVVAFRARRLAPPLDAAYRPQHLPCAQHTHDAHGRPRVRRRREDGRLGNEGR